MDAAHPDAMLMHRLTSMPRRQGPAGCVSTSSRVKITKVYPCVEIDSTSLLRALNVQC
jgi:hypothetical protein